MRNVAIGLAAVAVGVGVALAFVLLLFPVPRERLVDGYVLFVGGLLLLGLVHATRAAGGGGDVSLYERALRRSRGGGARPKELARLEREVVLSATSAFDVHMRLRPLLREVAQHRLSTARGLDLDAGSRETRALLGPELWELLQPEREPLNDRFAPVLPPPRLRAHLDTLERI